MADLGSGGSTARRGRVLARRPAEDAAGPADGPASCPGAPPAHRAGRERLSPRRRPSAVPLPAGWVVGVRALVDLEALLSDCLAARGAERRALPAALIDRRALRAVRRVLAALPRPFTTGARPPEVVVLSRSVHVRARDLGIVRRCSEALAVAGAGSSPVLDRHARAHCAAGLRCLHESAASLPGVYRERFVDDVRTAARLLPQKSARHRSTAGGG